MDTTSEVRDFLSTRRAKLTPQQAGLPMYGTNRRVPGLRRDEVALLAGISVEYYTRLERGNLRGVSESVLDAIATALQLDDAERVHLFDLARTANASTSSRRRSASSRVRPGIQRVLDAMITAPAWVRNGRSDVLATNRLGRALYSPLFEDPVRPANTARFAFLSPRGQEFYVDWESVAKDMVAVLRTEAGRNPYDKGLTDLIGELSTRSDVFRTLWATHNVAMHQTGLKRIHHPVAGDLDLSYEAMEIASDPGLTLLVYTAEPKSATDEALKFLGSWASTLHQLDEAELAHTKDD